MQDAGCNSQPTTPSGDGRQKRGSSAHRRASDSNLHVTAAKALLASQLASTAPATASPPGGSPASRPVTSGTLFTSPIALTNPAPSAGHRRHSATPPVLMPLRIPGDGGSHGARNVPRSPVDVSTALPMPVKIVQVTVPPPVPPPANPQVPSPARHATSAATTTPATPSTSTNPTRDTNTLPMSPLPVPPLPKSNSGIPESSSSRTEPASSSDSAQSTARAVEQWRAQSAAMATSAPPPPPSVSAIAAAAVAASAANGHPGADDDEAPAEECSRSRSRSFMGPVLDPCEGNPVDAAAATASTLMWQQRSRVTQQARVLASARAQAAARAQALALANAELAEDRALAAAAAAAATAASGKTSPPPAEGRPRGMSMSVLFSSFRRRSRSSSGESGGSSPDSDTKEGNPKFARSCSAALPTRSCLRHAGEHSHHHHRHSHHREGRAICFADERGDELVSVYVTDELQYGKKKRFWFF